MRALQRFPWLAALAVAAVLAQGLFFAASQTDAAAGTRLGRRWLDEGGPAGDLSALPLAASRSLAAMDRALPRDARVLVVSQTPFAVPYDFYLLPRRLRVLMELDEALVARAAAAYPLAGSQARRWYDLLEQRGQLLTPASLRDGLAWADHLVSFQADPAALGIEGLVPLAREGAAAAWRIAR